MAEEVMDGAMPQVATGPQGISEYFRRLAFLLIAVFILLAPAMPQVLGVNSVFFRPWTMFSGVGVGAAERYVRRDRPGRRGGTA